ncbi:MAG: ABC transporter ATP-binding protein [Verrucomicrobia bacterium]|nr:ABC transporter ATP-binding protein [Verrucomicrobiota bacterium]
MKNDSGSLLKVDDLRVYFRSYGQTVRAVDGVSLKVGRGETVGLVGESGCGKSTLGNAILRLVDIESGSLDFDGTDISSFAKRRLTEFREKAQMVFQDPFQSLNPRMTVGRAIEEVLYVHRKGDRMERRRKVAQLLEAVGLDASFADRYPHEFSGGQRQRIGIARALAVDPVLLIADEPVSALDVSVQVQILNLLKDLQKNFNLSFLFIAHDLAVVRYMCDRILVMYLGRIVEESPASELYDCACHPYTEALLSAIPDVDRSLSDKGKQARIVLSGDVPSPTMVTPGCPFHQRCHRVRPECKTNVPVFREISPGHFSACHFAEELMGKEDAGFRIPDAG